MDKNFSVVTVVVPVYNHEDYVLDCITSILDEDYPNTEVIVINDGSTDGTEEKVRDYIRRHGERFRFISKKNEGLVKTLNLGLKLAKGKYFCELASDDMLLPGSIRKRVEYLEANPRTEAVFADGYFLQDSTPTTTRLLGDKKNGYDSSRHGVEDLIMGNAVIFFPSGIIKKSLLDEIGGFDEDFRCYEDISIEYILAISTRVAYINEPLMYYRVHSSNTSLKNPERVKEEKVMALKKLLLRTEAAFLRKLIHKKLAEEYWKYFKVGLKAGTKKEKLMEILKNVVRMRPFHYKTIRVLFYMARLAISDGFLKEGM